MKLRLRPGRSLSEEVRRVATELFDDSLRKLGGRGFGAEAIHQARTNCKRIRGLLRIVRPQFPDTYRKENRAIREAAGSLSDLRDATAAIECYDRLLDRFGAEINRRELAPIRRALTRRKEQLQGKMDDLAERVAVFREQMQSARERAARWKLPEDGYPGVGEGLTKTYAGGREAMTKARRRPTVENYHTWRKRTKYLRYHCRLLQNVWKPVMKSYRRKVRDLSNILGDDHDLSLLRDILLEELASAASEHRIQVLLGLIDRMSAELRIRAHKLGRRVYAETPKQFRRRLGAYWKVAGAASKEAPGMSGAPGVVTAWASSRKEQGRPSEKAPPMEQ